MKTIIIFFTLICFVYGSRRYVDNGLHPLSDEMINQINSLGTTWKAGQNFDGVSLNAVKRLLGVPSRSNKASKRPLRYIHHRNTNDLPESFDSRTKWPNCTSLTTIRDQGNCGSCWVFSAIEAMSDRLCIHGSIDVLLSTQQMVTCYGDGCQGGWPESVYGIYQEEGIVSGGLYQGGGCSPYTLPPCEHHIKGPLPTCPDTYLPAPECKKECVAGYGKTWEQDKYYGQEPYAVGYDQKQIMKEIMTNGPVSADFTVYADFPNYKSGVYQRTTYDSLGGHAIKIIGWGTENGTDYWLVANSWNDYWGDKGYFKIRRGNNECGIEDDVVAGLPKL
ncbi:cathepsin B-like [Panonychus citri]|uniref:cathepsin B-like n=1 Tax=Panonychus citri TaxID=50023 RepID=UPI00230756A7|nr:cathepsin B-like [Panonychus citri]